MRTEFTPSFFFIAMNLEIILEIFILLAPLLPLLYSLSQRGFRKRLALMPRAIPFLIFASITYCIAVLLMFLFAPLLLRASALALSVVGAFFIWRALPNYGRARSLPRGSLAYFPIGPWRDQFYYQKQFRKYGAIFKTRELLQPMVCIVGLPRAQALLAQHQPTLITPPLQINRFVPHGLLRYMTPADHERFRAIYQHTFSRHALESSAPYLTNTVRAALAQIAQASQARGVNVLPHLEELIFRVLARVFFGITTDHPRFVEFTRAYRLLDFRSHHADDATTRATLDTLIALLRQGLDTAQQENKLAPSFLSELVALTNSAESMYYLNLIYTLIISQNDLAGLSHWLVQLLGENPIWLERLRAQRAEESAANNLAARIVQETLRLEQSEFLLRRTTRAIQFEGFTIPQNWYVRMCVWESHRDPNIFEQPNIFNPDRFLNRVYSRAEYAPFGLFKKSCLGEHTTLWYSKALVLELARAYEVQIRHYEKPEFSGFHWQPSSKLRVALTPCSRTIAS